MKKFLRIFLCAAIFILLLPAAGLAAGTDWNEGSITAEGIGVFPSDVENPGQASAMARRAAIVDAYRNLGEYVESVRVTAETTVRNSMVESDVIKTKMSAVIKEAVIAAEGIDSYGNYRVVLKMPIYGENSLASAVFQKPAAVEPFLPPTVKRPPLPPTVVTSGEGRGKGYTGLVVDCRELELTPVMSPVIYDENMRPIYGYDNLDYQKVISLGMADYEKDAANFKRAGGNPLVVKAIALDGHGANPVISEADANYVLAENAKAHFLDNLAVVFIFRA